MPVRSTSRAKRITLTDDPQVMRSFRQAGELALSRASGAPLVAGNQVRILENADGNYPVWLEAIRGARRFVFLENYIFDEDEVGIAFADALAERARAGVQVRVIRDWMGTFTGSSRAFWRRLSAAGAEVRCFNAFHFITPFGWLSRDHRKMIAVDGEVAFVAGLCISRQWKGDPARGVLPWRDTGLEIRGPAVADVEAAFAQIWESMGEPVPPHELSREDKIARAGDVNLRIVAGAPNLGGLLRMDQLIAAIARRALWLTDAYFVGISSYVQALRSAARDGVDVRLLVPNASDLPLVRSLSRAGYRPLLEAGVRIFEWNGSMVHAKTAVVDGRWSRIGSSNLNIASFFGNYELDVAIEDEGVAAQMEQMYLRDLSNATEIELAQNRVVSIPGADAPAEPPEGKPGPRGRRPRAAKGAGSSPTAAGAIRVANAVGAAVTNHRVLGAAERGTLVVGALILILLAAVATLWPRVVAVPLTIVALWVGISLLWRAAHLARRHKDVGRRQSADP